MAEPVNVRLKRVWNSLTDASAPSTLQTLVKLAVLPDQRNADLGDLSQVAGERGEIRRVAPPQAPPDTVPPLLFQTWKSRVSVPENYRYWRNTFIAHNPGWTFVLWDDEDNRALIAQRFPWFLQRYDSYPREIYRADAIRFFFLFLYGGVYADMDAECLRPLEGSLGEGDVILCRMGADAEFPHSVPNAVMASRPRQAFWLLAIRYMMQALDAARAAGAPFPSPEAMTGPVLLKRTYDAYVSPAVDVAAEIAPVLELLDADLRASVRMGEAVLHAKEQWYPLDWTNLIHKRICEQLRGKRRVIDNAAGQRIFPRSSVVTYWSHSW
jgi:inositol phosphorylceramide mannosyltransferase catalytic subunit